MIKEWSLKNKLLLNIGKTKEIVFHRPHPTRLTLPPSLENIERVVSAKVLGIILTSALNFDLYISGILKTCSQRLYLLNQLRRQGLSVDGLNVVFNAIIVSKLLYCSPVWRGYMNSNHLSAIQKLFKKAHSWGLCAKLYNIDQLFQNNDELLFRKMMSKHHCLHHILPPERTVAYNLRQRGHCHELISYRTEFARKCFIIRSLYDNI